MLFFVMSCDYVCRTYMHVSISSRHVYYCKQLRFCQQPVASTHLGQRKNPPRRYQRPISWVALYPLEKTILDRRFFYVFLKHPFGKPLISGERTSKAYARFMPHGLWISGVLLRSRRLHFTCTLTSAHRRLKGCRMGALNSADKIELFFSVRVYIVYFDSINRTLRCCWRLHGGFLLSPECVDTALLDVPIEIWTVPALLREKRIFAACKGIRLQKEVKIGLLYEPWKQSKEWTVNSAEFQNSQVVNKILILTLLTVITNSSWIKLR